MPALTYFSCNADSIFLCTVIVFLIIIFSLLLKVIVNGEIYHAFNQCYPPAFFFGFIESARHMVYDLTNHTKSTNSSVKESFQNEIQNLGKQISNIPGILESMSTQMLNFYMAVFRERFGSF